MTIDYQLIGKQIKRMRLSRGWTQALLAEKSGIEPSNISHIERGATKLSFPTLVNIANALEVSLDEIVYKNLIKSEHVSVKEIDELLNDCTSSELFAIAEIIKTTKKILRSK